MSKLANLKAGNKKHTITNILGTSEKVSLVILTSDETIMAKSDALKYIKEKSSTDAENDKESKKKGKDKDFISLDYETAPIILNAFILFYAMRDPDDSTLQKRYAESAQEILDVLTVKQIVYLVDRYIELMADVPTFDGITEDEFNELKKLLGTLQWSELSGVSCVHLKRFLQTQQQEQ